MRLRLVKARNRLRNAAIEAAKSGHGGIAIVIPGFWQNQGVSFLDDTHEGG
jgi:hypothetical protein